MSKKLKIGVLGGSFDPVHNAHLEIARAAMAKLKLDEVLFVPCYLAPHREGKKLSSVKHRVAMLKRALKNQEKLKLSLIEIKRKGISYTVDTLKALKKEYPTGTQLYFILGSDSWLQLPTWKNYKTLIHLCEFVVFNRKGFPFRAASDGRKATNLKIRPLKIASTAIRDQIKNGQIIKSLVPKEVETYIEKNKVYKKV